MDYLPLSYSRGSMPAWVNATPFAVSQPQPKASRNAPYGNPFDSQPVISGDTFTPSASAASVAGPAFAGSNQAFTVQNITNPFAQHAEETLGDAWANDSITWGTRAVGAHWADELLKTSVIAETNAETGQSISKAWKLLAEDKQAQLDGLATGAKHWREVLGLNNKTLTYGVSEGKYHLASYKDLFSVQGIEKYRNVLGKNFKTFLDPKNFSDMTARSLFKQTVLGGNVQSLIEPFKEGGLLKASTGALALGAMAYGIVDNTHKTWSQSRAKGDGLLTSLVKTAAAFVGQALKAGVSWEAGTIGGILGGAIFSFGAVPALIGTAVVGAFFGTMAHKAMSTIVPDID